MSQVPTYALYGEPGARLDDDFLHCETIAVRSRLHGFSIRPHRHEQLFQMLFLSSGAATAVLDGVRAELPPPCLVVVPPCVVHGYSFSNDVEGLVLTLYEQRIAAVLRSSADAVDSLADPRVIPLANQPEAARMVAASLTAVASEFAGHAAGRLAMIEAQLAIAWLAAYRAQAVRPSPATGAPPRGVARVARFRQMIERDFRTRAPIEDYARHLGMTPVHLRRLCRDHLGTTPLGAVNARIVLEAKRLLVFSSLEVKEVAAAVGFADHAYFSRFFQRETGLAPTAFRATRRMTGPPPSAGPPRSADRPPATGRSAA